MYKLLLVSVLAFAVVGVGASVHRQPFVPLHRATALCGCLYASLHNDFVRPLSCILCTFMNALLVSHPCETLGVHFIRHPCLTRKLRVLPPTAPKIIPRLLSGRKCSGVSNCGRLGRCIVQRLCATAIVHPCTSCLLCWFRIVRNFGQALSRILAFAVVGVGASLRRQPFVPLRLCIDSHLCRCIVQRLCVAVFMHPCITALCGCLYASLHNDFVRPLSCILARL